MTAVGPLMSSIATTLAAALDPAPVRVVVSPGDSETWDDCCEGMLWLRVVTASAEGGRTTTGAKAFTVFSCEVGVLRCETTVGDDGSPPSAEAVTADSVQMFADMDAVREALATVQGAWVDQWIPSGPEGGCVGGRWRFHLKVVNP